MSGAPCRALRPVLCAATALAVAACGEAVPAHGAGTVTATLISPNGAEGAALITLFGDGIGEVSAIDGRVYSLRRGDSVRVVVTSDQGGTLAFRVALADTTLHPTAAVLQVAGPDDALRIPLAHYAVEIRK
jgi:hypothetical protein